METLSDDAAVTVFARVPFAAHATVRCVCRRLRALLESSAFRRQRLESGYAEHGVAVLGGFRENARVADAFVLANGRWRRAARLRAPLSHCAAAVVAADAAGWPEVWLLGGKSGSVHTLGEVVAYSPRLDAWRAGPPLLGRRTSAVAGACGGALVVAGGWTRRDGRLATAEAYRPARGAWVSLPDLPHAAYMATACVLDDRLYVAGGEGCAQLQVWDPKRAAWSVRAELPAARCNAASAALGGQLVVLGGRVLGEPGPSASVLVYDPRADAWSAPAALALPSGRFGCRAGVLEGRLVVVGDGAPLCYRDGAWAELPRAPDAPFHAHSAGVAVFTL